MKTARELELEGMSVEELEARMNRLQTRREELEARTNHLQSRLEEIRPIYYRKRDALTAQRKAAARRTTTS